MDLQRKTLGQLMSNVLGIGNQSKDVKADADELDADTTPDDDEQEGADEADESADDAENEDEQEEAPKKKATAAKAKTAAANVTMSLAEYNALKADADQAKTLKAANTTLKTKASAWDAHQKAIGGAAPKADTTNDAPETEENTEAKEMNRLSERYKGMIPA